LKPKILIFQPAWACKEVITPLITCLSEKGYEAIVVENPKITGATTLRDIYEHNKIHVEQVIKKLAPGQKIVGVGLSQGGHSLMRMCNKIGFQEHFKSAVLFGTPMLSRRLTTASIGVTIKMVLTKQYHGIFRSIFTKKGNPIQLLRSDVVSLLFGEEKTEWREAIDAVANQCASSRALAEMVTGSIRKAGNVPIAVVRCDGEVFHSNTGAFLWLGKKSNRRPGDSFHLIGGTHFGSLVPGDGLRAFTDIIIARCY
jgi:hypothetical protein